MQEKPILFTAPMVRAILDGRKTVTRRLVKPQPVLEDAFVGGIFRQTWIYKDTADPQGWLMHNLCPYGQPGDRLWVRERFAKDITGCPNGIAYRADHQDPYGDGPANPITWKPSIHMPRWASRITLEVAGVRVEPLQGITEEDAKAEGTTPSIVGADLDYLKYRAGFQALWDSINGKTYPWSANPWVWVVEFRKIAPE